MTSVPWRRLAGAPEISPVQVGCKVLGEPLTGDRSNDARGRRGLNVDGGPASRRVRDRLVRCRALSASIRSPHVPSGSSCTTKQGGT